MRRTGGLCAAFGLLAVTAVVSPSAGEALAAKRYVLTMEGVRELARSRAPAILGARARIEQARAEGVAAAVRQPFNPELVLAAGPRRSDGRDAGTDVAVEIGQRFETGGRRRARIDLAAAGVARADAEASDAEREVLRDAVSAFLAAVHAERTLEVVRENERLSAELRRVADRRFETGDVGILDPYAAAMADARAGVRVAQAEAGRVAALGELRILLGLESDAEIVVEGNLTERRRLALDAAIARAADRSDVRALAAELERARAERRLARGMRSPALGAFVSFDREEGDEIVKGGLSIELPVVARAQGLSAAAEARRRALEIELEAARRSAASEVRSGHDASAILDAAAARFEAEALPRLDETLDLARRSYEAGNIPLGELLTVQREAIDTRLAYLDLLLEAALAGHAVETAAGVMP